MNTQTSIIKTAVGPTPKRIEILDILRGFTIFGILLINIISFASAAYTPGYIAPNLGLVDQIAQKVTLFLAEGKFYSLFSLLFGLGFALQLARAEAKNVTFIPFHLRRMFILLLIGIAHSLLLWDGDILMLYAVLGMALLLFRNAKPRTLLIWSAVFLLISTVLLTDWGTYGGEMGDNNSIAATVIDLFSNGRYVELVQYRVENFGDALIGSIFQGVSVFAMCLLGLFIGKREFFTNIAANRTVFKRWLGIGLLVGIPGNILYLWATPC